MVADPDAQNHPATDEAPGNEGEAIENRVNQHVALLDRRVVERQPVAEWWANRLSLTEFQKHDRTSVQGTAAAASVRRKGPC